jgi:hypothetical protein
MIFPIYLPILAEENMANEERNEIPAEAPDLENDGTDEGDPPPLAAASPRERLWKPLPGLPLTPEAFRANLRNLFDFALTPSNEPES